MPNFEDIRRQIEEYEPQSYLLTWNPKVFHWNNFDNCIKKIKQNGPIIISWSTCTKKIQGGDNLFLMKLGCGKDNGIIGYGKALETIDSCAYNLERVKKPWFIDAIFTKLEKEPLISQTELKQRFPKQCWSPQSSGIRIDNRYMNELMKIIMSNAIHPTV